MKIKPKKTISYSSRAFGYVVKLDGKIINGIVSADDKAGTVSVCYTQPEDAYVQFLSNSNTYVAATYKGKVKIIENQGLYFEITKEARSYFDLFMNDKPAFQKEYERLKKQPIPEPVE